MINYVINYTIDNIISYFLEKNLLEIGINKTTVFIILLILV